jgi:hypothetical protein
MFLNFQNQIRLELLGIFTLQTRYFRYKLLNQSQIFFRKMVQSPTQKIICCNNIQVWLTKDVYHLFCNVY